MTIDKTETMNKIDRKKEILGLYNLLELICDRLYTKEKKIAIGEGIIMVSLEGNSYNPYKSPETAVTDTEEEIIMPLVLQRNKTVKSGNGAIIIQDGDKVNKRIEYNIELSRGEKKPSIRLYLEQWGKDEDGEEYYHIIGTLSNRAYENNSQKDYLIVFKEIINEIASHVLTETELQSHKVVSKKTAKELLKMLQH